MKTIVTMAAAISCGITLTATVNAQDSSNFGNGKFYPLDMYSCALKDGVTMKDVDKLDRQFAKWAEQHDPGQTAWRMTPQWREDNDLEVAYLGTWATGAMMGHGMKAWSETAGEVSAAYAEKMTCNHSMASSMPIDLPEDYEPGSGVVWFSRCSVEEGAGWGDAVKAHTATAAAMEELGSDALNWLVRPGLGFGETGFDYYHVAAFPGYEALGAGFDTFFSGGGMHKQREATAGVISCGSPNVYDVTLIRAGSN